MRLPLIQVLVFAALFFLGGMLLQGGDAPRVLLMTLVAAGAYGAFLAVLRAAAGRRRGS